MRAAAERADEPVWPLPLPARYRSQLDSDVADLKNIGSEYGGALAAGLFLQEFVGGVPWAHLDIAGPMKADRDDGWRSKGATAFGVRTIIEVLRPLHPAALDPLLVLRLQRDGQAAELAVAQRRQPLAHAHAVAVGLGQPELDAALEGPGEGAVAARRGAQPEGAGHLVQVELEAVGVGVEGVGQPAQQPRGRRAEHAEPELLDVG